MVTTAIKQKENCFSIAKKLSKLFWACSFAQWAVVAKIKQK